MRIEDIGIKRLPFQTEGRPGAFVHYQSQLAANDFLEKVMKDSRGIGVLYGPASSGKTTLVGEFVRNLPENRAVAVVDGSGIGASELLATILAQFGHKPSIEVGNNRSDLLNEIAARVVREKEAPLLVLENISKMYPTGLVALRELASLTDHQKFAIRFILVNESDYFSIIESPEMNPIGTRLIGSFELGPLTAKETVKYLQAKLRASGVVHPHRVFPLATCVELHKESGGWPGKLDRLAMSAIERVDRAPVRREQVSPTSAQRRPVRRQDAPKVTQSDEKGMPKLLVTSNGKFLRAFEVNQSKITLGRARLNDLVINNQYASKYHALLIFNNNTMFLVDLKSSNGLFVNSRRVRSTVLRHDDVIEIGNHKIKVSHASGPVAAAPVESELVDTSIMKTVADMRRAVAKKILRIAPTKKQDSI